MADTPDWWPLQWEESRHGGHAATILIGGHTVTVHDLRGDEFEAQMASMIGYDQRAFITHVDGKFGSDCADEFELLIALTALASVPA